MGAACHAKHQICARRLCEGGAADARPGPCGVVLGDVQMADRAAGSRVKLAWRPAVCEARRFGGSENCNFFFYLFVVAVLFLLLSDAWEFFSISSVVGELLFQMGFGCLEDLHKEWNMEIGLDL
ncbi:hypothetical protein Taro_033706 [Colocasia esculenta]|uniref:Uncharacterized protein n=1 Tax=Colocasia esculenta TaxID=4460 RepID=A0A843VVX7_COLES|nr:hypothetical protein [Colocasia esculenta]